MTSNSRTNPSRLLLVDDKQPVLTSQQEVCQISNLQITAGEDSGDLHLIDAHAFEVALCNVTLEFGRTHPIAVVLVFTGYPALQQAMEGLRRQGDQLLGEVSEAPALVELIGNELQKKTTYRSSNLVSPLEYDILTIN